MALTKKKILIHFLIVLLFNLNFIGLTLFCLQYPNWVIVDLVSFLLFLVEWFGIDYYLFDILYFEIKEVLNT